MAGRADEDQEPLLNPGPPVAPARSYGSLNGHDDENNDDDDNNDEQRSGSDQHSLLGAARSTSTVESKGCLGAILARDSHHRRLLGFNILAILLGVVTSGLIFLELELDLGQCIIGMPLYEGGLLARGVKRYWCRCPLYTVMLCSTIPWISIMVNWVSDLFSKKCAYGKWLKWQAILTTGGTVAAFGAALTSTLGFGNWCSRVVKSLDMEDLYSYSDTVTVQSYVRRECYSAAVAFDTRFHDEFVKLKHTFWFNLGITILQCLLLACWAGSCYYAVRMWTSLPKDTFFAQMLLPPELRAHAQLNRRANEQNPGEQVHPSTAADAGVNQATAEAADIFRRADSMSDHPHHA